MQDLTSIPPYYMAHVQSGRPQVVDAILPRLVGLSKAYLIRNVEGFVKKLNVMQNYLNSGLQEPLSPSSKTLPGDRNSFFSDLVHLRYEARDGRAPRGIGLAHILGSLKYFH